VMSIIFRFAERDDGGTGGPTSSGSPAIDLANIRCRSKFTLPILLHR
jgi:hypothetical protein